MAKYSYMLSSYSKCMCQIQLILFVFAHISRIYLLFTGSMMIQSFNQCLEFLGGCKVAHGPFIKDVVTYEIFYSHFTTSLPFVITLTK